MSKSNSGKRIDLKEHKKILVEILEYFDKFCRKHDIKYSLVGGSLIGAIRHKGIIPWDDDIDVVLMPKDYEKLIKAFKKEKGRYQMLVPCETEGYIYPFAKLIDTHTFMKEDDCVEMENYGIYIDIFAFHYVPDEKSASLAHYKKVAAGKHKIGISVTEVENEPFYKRLIRKFYYANRDKICQRFCALCTSKTKTKHVLTNWPTYGHDREVIPAEWMDEYIDCDFEGIKAMIMKEYDKALRTFFGDYMELPPKEQRVTHHHFVAKWK